MVGVWQRPQIALVPVRGEGESEGEGEGEGEGYALPTGRNIH